MWYGIVQDQITKQLRAQGRAAAGPERCRCFGSGQCGGVPVPALLPAAVLLQHVVLSHPAARSGELPVRDLVAHLRGRRAKSPKLRWSRPCCRTTARSSRRSRSRTIRTSRCSSKACMRQGFEFMRLSKDIEGLISNYQRIIDGYLARRGARQAGQGHTIARRQFRREDSRAGIVSSALSASMERSVTTTGEIRPIKPFVKLPQAINPISPAWSAKPAGKCCWAVSRGWLVPNAAGAKASTKPGSRKPAVSTSSPRWSGAFRVCRRLSFPPSWISMAAVCSRAICAM